jgi:2-oxoglutarate dehydrogenase E1 component
MTANSRLDTFLSGTNGEYVRELLDLWRKAPDRVPADWRALFEAEAEGDADGPAFKARSIFHGPSLPATWTEKAADTGYCARHMGVLRLIDAYRAKGHECADLDPLGVGAGPVCTPPRLEAYGLAEKDLDTAFPTGDFEGGGPLPLREIQGRLRRYYNGTVGLQIESIVDPEERAWLRARIESDPASWLTADQERRAAIGVIRAERFERFLHKKFLGTKRFSLEGCEALIPALAHLIETAGDGGVTTMIFGMAHRGRINVLANILKKPLETIYGEFEDVPDPELSHGAGDVKYHVGFNHHHVTRSGREIYLALTPNPSHLEAVDPVVEGRVRARQDREGAASRARIVPVLIHGDAAFAGQGMVAEVLNLSKLTGYRTGGTLHVLINNQLGFTTAPRFARSTPYPTDVARMIDAPVLHVNGDDVRALLHVTGMALAYRQKFRKDVVVDVVCFRRYGHNETDEPSFTQPTMYRRIDRHPGVRAVYLNALAERGVVPKGEAEQVAAEYEAELSRAYDATRRGDRVWSGISTLSGPWSGMREATAEDVEREVETGVPREVLAHLAARITTVPARFHPHKKIARVLDDRRRMGRGEAPLDWGMGEHLALASLLREKTPVRLSGQDSRRGTFSHRHAVLVDAEDGGEYIPLSHVGDEQAPFYAWDSSLAEASVLGFEFGYSLDSPHTLVIWEAQFGDFANGAQVIVDQFIASAETKWKRQSGLVLLLPHGYEGQGAEHSSARIERFLQLAAEYNLEIANATTPAQYFHLLRRQMRRPFRKPLVLFTPKSLLRRHEAASPIEAFTRGGFREVIGEDEPESVRRIVLCSGKIYYDLAAARAEGNVGGVTLVRVEQLYPLPEKAIGKILARHPGAEVVWAQEEPRNAGAWAYMALRFAEKFPGRKLAGVSRPEMASPASGYVKVHQEQQAAIIREALGMKQAED